MSIDEKIFKFPKNFCWETNGQLAELIKQAEEQLPHLEENSIGYYYYWMLQELKKSTKPVSVSLDKCPRCDLPLKNGECIYKTHNAEQPVTRSYAKCWECGYLGFDIEKHNCQPKRPMEKPLNQSNGDK